MTCYSPLTGYRSRFVNPSGKRSIVFSPKDGFKDLKVQVPCGQCIGCRLDRSLAWATRCVHEASLYDDNCFLTLTYDDEHLPVDGSLVPSHFTDFMKRLRRRLEPRKVRYYMCGEYGDENGRPHYHALIFNYDFPDKVAWGKSRGGDVISVSAGLSSVWTKGFSTIGDVTFSSAAYVARYIAKKVTGDKASEHYQSVNPVTGEIFEVEPEYSRMSLKPGIGTGWFEKFKSDAFPSDFVVLNGRKMRVPKYYEQLFERNLREVSEDARELLVVKARRRRQAAKSSADQTAERLAVRETVKLAQYSQLKRSV
mgnify:CR=1 FL=1